MGAFVLAIARGVDIGAAGDDEPIETLEDARSLLQRYGLWRNHHRQPTGTSDGLDVLRGQDRELSVVGGHLAWSSIRRESDARRSHGLLCSSVTQKVLGYVRYSKRAPSEES